MTDKGDLSRCANKRLERLGPAARAEGQSGGSAGHSADNETGRSP